MIECYIKRPRFIFAVLVMFLFLGIIGFFEIPRDLFPPSDRPQVAVVVVEPGASAHYIADHVANPIEKELYTIDGIRRVYSNSVDGFTTIFAEFHYSKPIGEAKVDVSNALTKIENELPKDIEPPQIYEITSYTPPVMVLSIRPKKNSNLSLADVRYIASNFIKKEILLTGKVSNVDVFGGYKKEIDIEINSQKLASFGLSPIDVINAIKLSNKDSPLGIVQNKEDQHSFVLLTEAKNISDLCNIYIKENLNICSVAKVKYSIPILTSIFRGNGHKAIALAIERPYGGAVLPTIEAVEKVLPKIKREFPNLDIEIADTQKRLVELSNENMLEALRDAIIFTALVIFLFLADIRMTIISALSIPFVYLATIAIMWILGIGFNMITLTAIILALGMLVDDAIVILENIERHFTELGERPFEAAVNGTKEVMLVVFGGTISTVAVLFPLLFVGSFPEKIFRPLAGTLIIAVIVSYFVSITFIPLVATRFLASEKNKKFSFEEKINNFMKAWLIPLRDIYLSWINLLITNKKLRIPLNMFLIGLFVLSMRFILPIVGRDLMPPMDTGIAKAKIIFNSNTSIYEENKELKKIERYIYILWEGCT